MIVTVSSSAVEAKLAGQISWREAVRRAIREPRQLLSAVGLTDSNVDYLTESDFPIFVPWEFVRRMETGNPRDPLLRQVLATSEELLEIPGFGIDPVGDLAAQKTPGLLQKYQGRALLVATGSCAVHCRYCFRRQFPYQFVPKSPSGWRPLLEELARDRSIEEIILSGGDPLMLADASLRWLVDQINSMPHIRRLRIHTRMPVIIPQRVDDEMLSWLQRVRPALYCVLHVNHAHEIDDDVRRAFARLRSVGATLLNQAVLLRGVNDTPEAQLELCTLLLDSSVIPYYLHLLDRVHGTSHFEVAVSEGRRLVEYLRARLPGYGVPRLVSEVPGEPSKTPL